MSGVQITAANVNEAYASKMNALNAQLKNGEVTLEAAKNELLNFRTEHAAAFKEAGVNFSKDDAEAEAKDTASKAYSLELKMGADEVGRKAAEQTKAGQTTGQDIKKLSPIERKALGAIQSEFQHGDDVVALENGKVVVKSKTTGEVNTKKTEQAQKAYDEWHLDVDGTPVDTTITKDSVNPHAKVGLVDREDAKKMREYDTKQKAHNEFTNESITKQDIKNAKQAVKDAKKEAKALQKQAKAARKAGDYEKADQLEEKAAELNGNLAEKQNDYEKKKALGSTKGERGIAKAAKHNAKRYDKIDNVGKVLLPGQEDVASAVDGKESGKTVTLSKGQAETLSRLHGYSKYMLGKFEKDLEKAKATGDEASIKSAEEALDAAKTKYGDLATCMEDGKVNVEKLQTGLAQFSGGDYKFNLDEKKALGAESGVKKGDIASLAKAVGFGNESKMKGKLAAGGVAAAATALGSLIGTHKHSATATARDEKTATSPDAFDEKTAREWFKFMDSNGNPVYKEISVTAKAHAKGVTATAVAEAVAKASSKVPILGQLAGPALAGVTAFFMANPQTEDAFNGNKVETVLKNLSTVSGADNKKIVAQIQDMKITGDPQRDKVIKAAVIEASINGKANTEELLAAYESLKDTKKAIEEIDNYKEPTVSTTPPPAPPAPPTPTTPPVTKKIGGWARDHKLLDKRGVPQDQREVNGTGKGRAQIVIADEEGEIAITGDRQAPDTIKIKDNTNQKINTFEYRKLTDEEVAKGVTKGGVKLTGLGGRKGPFYILTKAIDTQGNLRNRHPEVYQLELDDNDDTTNYHLEQYDGMNGSGVSSMQWENRATRKHRTHRRK